MKTLFLCDDGNGSNIFFEKDGNYSHLDNCFINSDSDEELQKELLNILFGDDENCGNYIIEKLDKPTKDWDFFVEVGFLL